MLDVFERHKYDQGILKKSKTWFDQQTLLLAKEGIRPNRVHKSSGEVVSTIKPGNLYMFFYDPKGKDTLPHYDRFPLVFPFSKTENGFIGLNMHYLPTRLRVVLLDNLLKFKNTKTIDENTRLRYSWNVLKGISKHRLVTPCVKQYLTSNVQSQIKIISAENWTTAMMLPVESFAKESKTKIWKQVGVN
jgi:hypothetical protein